MQRRIFSLVLTSLTLIVMLAAPASAGRDKELVGLLTQSPSALTKGSTTWIPFVWESLDRNLQHFHVTVESVDAGIDIVYPSENTSSALWENQLLSKNEIDFTAIRVQVPADFSGPGITMELKATYGINENGSATKSAMFSVFVPVVQHTGDDVVQVTTDVGSMTVGTAAWADIAFKGLAPLVTDFRVEVLDGGGVSYLLPQGSYTSLDGDAALEQNETDVVRMYIDTSGLAEGSHTIQLRVLWQASGETKAMDTSVTLTVNSGA